MGKSIFLKTLLSAVVASTLSFSCTSGTGGDGDEAAAAYLLLALSGSGNSTCPSSSLPSGASLASTVLQATGASSATFHDPAKATNGICGGGESAGSTDVYTLADTGSDATLILGFSQAITNGSGLDLIVYENPFRYGSNVFIEPMIVEVGNASGYCGFSPDYVAADESSFSANPDDWSNFAGLHPVILKQDGSTNPTVDQIFQDTNSDGVPDTYGGDGVDLDDLASGCALSSDLQTNGVTKVRLVSATAVVNPDTADPLDHYPKNDMSGDGGPDVDGVVGRVR